MVQIDSRPQSTRIMLRPNRSISWQQTRWVILAFAGLTLLIATGWSLAGAWMILPFAGLEIGLFSWLMYRVCRNTYQCQVITLDENRIVVEGGISSPVTYREFDSRSAILLVTDPDHEFDGPDLQLEDGDCSLPIGSFLNRSDRLLARKQLEEAGLPVMNRQWWLKKNGNPVACR